MTDEYDDQVQASTERPRIADLVAGSPSFGPVHPSVAAALSATTPETVSAKAGEVVEIGVRATGDDPVRLYAEGIDAPLRLTPGEDGDLRAFLAVGPGTTRVTAHAGAASPVEFTITTDPAAVEPAADTEGDDS